MLQYNSLLYILISLLIYLAFLVYGAIFIQANFYFKSKNRLKNKHAILLTFDDGPDPIYTPQILDLLEKYKLKAVFFMIGEKAKDNPDLVKEVHKRGHSIANHSFSHHHLFDLKSTKKMTEELKKTTVILESLIKDKISFFRPPFGVSNPNLKRAIANNNLVSIGWTFRSFDTTKKQKERIVEKIKSKITGGEILLFHDNRAKSVEVLKLSLPFLSKFEQGGFNNEEIN